jgi:hypothetical protein
VSTVAVRDMLDKWCRGSGAAHLVAESPNARCRFHMQVDQAAVEVAVRRSEKEPEPVERRMGGVV